LSSKQEPLEIYCVGGGATGLDGEEGTGDSEKASSSDDGIQDTAIFSRRVLAV